MVKGAVHTGNTGNGLEWMFDGFSADLPIRVYDTNLVGQAFEVRPWPSGTGTFEFGRQGAPIQAVPITEPTASDPALITNQEPNTAESSATAAGLESCFAITQQQLEDQPYDIGVFLDEMEYAFADGFEDAIINGDTAGTHMDNDTEGLGSVAATILDGLVDYAVTGSYTYDAGAAAMSMDVVRGMAKALASRYQFGNQCALILSNNNLISLGADSELASNAQLSQQSTVIDPVITSIYGFRWVIRSHRSRDTVAATGVNTVGGPNTFSRPLLVNTSVWKIYEKAALDIQIEKKPGAAAVFMSGRQRFALVNMGQASTASVAMAIEVTP
jgi:hypothetical protein